MNRKAFILTEILTGMMLQSILVLALFGAFYMLLTFSTSTQQILAAHDEGQAVIAYIDARIRNAGVGLWNCTEASSGKVSPKGIAEAFNAGTNFVNVNALDATEAALLPVAVTSIDSDGKMKIVSKDGVYEGNILTLLYARKDRYTDRMVLYGHKTSTDQMITLPAHLDKTGRQQFKMLDNNRRFGSTNTDFDFMSVSQSNIWYTNIKSWAVMEASGRPVHVSTKNGVAKLEQDGGEYIMYINAPYKSADIHPMSELLVLECERLFCNQNNNFMFKRLGESNKNAAWVSSEPLTQSILELYMTLDTKHHDVPVLDLNVLVSEGLRSDGEDTTQPQNWPDNAPWREDFKKHKVHVSRASWKLYNLAPLSY